MKIAHVESPELLTRGHPRLCAIRTLTIPASPHQNLAISFIRNAIPNEIVQTLILIQCKLLFDVNAAGGLHIYGALEF